MVVNGNPAYTLFKKTYREYYGDTRASLAEEFNLDPQKRWVFVPENYGWAFFRDHMVRDRIRRGFDPEDAFQYRDFALESLRAAARWWCDASTIDTIELIIRPRPAIPEANFVQTIQEIVGEVPETLRVIKDGTINKWILASDVVVSSYSTSLLEAAVAQKPLFMLAPIPFPRFIYADWHSHVERVESYEDFVRVIAQPQLPSNWRVLENWTIARMMNQGDALANLAETLFTMVRESEPSKYQRDFMQHIDSFTWDRTIRTIRKFGWNSIQDFLALIGVQTADRNWVSHEQDEVLDAEVVERVKQWAQVLG